MTRKYHPNTILTDDDVEQIRQLIEWKRDEIARINSIASCAAIAEKFDVSYRTIQSISAFQSRRIRSPDLSYGTPRSEQTKRKMSKTKLAIDKSLAGEYTRRTGREAIDVIREMAPTHTKTEVAKFFGWAEATCITSWLKLRGYEVEFKKHAPSPPKHNPWCAIDLGSTRAQSPASL